MQLNLHNPTYMQILHETCTNHLGNSGTHGPHAMTLHHHKRHEDTHFTTAWSWPTQQVFSVFQWLHIPKKWDFKKWSNLEVIQWCQCRGRTVSPCPWVRPPQSQQRSWLGHEQHLWLLGTCTALPSSYSGTQTNRGQRGKGSTNAKVFNNAFSASEKSISHRPQSLQPLRLQTLLLGPHVPLLPTRQPSQRQHCMQGMLQGLEQAGFNCSNLSLYLPLLLSCTAWRRTILSKTCWGISSKNWIKAKTHFKGDMSI